MATSPANELLFEIYRGDDIAYQVTILDSEQNPIDITGWTFRATMKLNFMADDDQAAVAVDVGPLEGADAEAGKFFLLLPNAQTAGLVPASYFFDLQRELDGLVSTVIRGRVRVIGDVTRRTA